MRCKQHSSRWTIHILSRVWSPMYVDVCWACTIHTRIHLPASQLFRGHDANAQITEEFL